MQFTKLNSTHIINGTHTTDTDHCNSCKTTLLLDVLIFKTYPNSELRPLPIWQRQYWSDMEVVLSSLVCVFFPIRSLNSRCPLPPLPPSCTRFLRYQGDTSTILGWYQGDTRCSPAVHLCMLHLSPHCTTPAHSRWTVGELVNYRWAGVMVVEGDSEDFLCSSTVPGWYQSATPVHLQFTCVCSTYHLIVPHLLNCSSQMFVKCLIWCHMLIIWWQIWGEECEKDRNNKFRFFCLKDDIPAIFEFLDLKFSPNVLFHAIFW